MKKLLRVTGLCMLFTSFLGAQEIVLDAEVDVNAHQIKNLAKPTDPEDAVTKSYADELVSHMGLMHFNGMQQFTVTTDRQSIAPTSKAFVYVNSEYTTMNLPDIAASEYGDVIYIYQMKRVGGERMFVLQPGTLPIAYIDGLNQFVETSDLTYGKFPHETLIKLVRMTNYWACSGFEPYELPNVDRDGDGFTENEGDCDDTKASIFPGALDIEDGIDNDCDNEFDEDSGDSDA